MDIFSANPKTFKLHRKSPFARKLKSSIAVKLPQFLSEYTDDVLAEYITVLVCNGKHQYQAKEDLEAFLGDVTVDFVSWLWNLMLEYAGQSSADTGLLNADEVATVSYQESKRCKGASTDRCAEFQNHSTRHADELLMKDDKAYHMSTCDPVSCEDVKLAKGFQSVPFSEVNTKKTLSRTCRNEILKRPIATDNINFQNCLIVEQILKHESSELPKELLHLPKREAESKVTQYVISGRPCPKEICGSNPLESSLSPRLIGTGFMHSKKPRGSVWDRLGKPCEDIFVGHKNVHFYGVGHMTQDGGVHNQPPLMPLKRNLEVPALGTRSYSHPVETRKLNRGGSAMGEPHSANNIGRKRLFGEIRAGPGTGSASLVHERNMDPQYKDISQNFKKPNLTKNGSRTTQKLASEVLEVKERLHQIEMEMSKLQSKQVVKVDHLSKSDILKDLENNTEIESRTVLVTNVHFSATREALSSFFAKCGGVFNVVILTDVVTAKPQGSAYVTFDSKESVDKALALSGTTFYSRIVKVLRIREAASAASAPNQISAKTFHAHVPHGNKNAIPKTPHFGSSSLQWRREPSTDPSAAAPKHLSDSDKEGNASSTEPAATAGA
ncbi:hypothetical protein C1H46_004637 [Malus baccata]|uniref:RRM domain-containing protein n=1 Tax=Malus baccata TaxID=106549 RepID=A0A540NGM7_MALBA|nr:hypothetical protein C1H46_004637 [Malus baccata]